jgi:hypothetical protein
MDSTRLLLTLLPWEFDIFLVGSPLFGSVPCPAKDTDFSNRKLILHRYLGNYLGDSAA